MKTKGLLCILAVVFAVGLMFGNAKAAEFKIVIMQDDKGAAERYQPLLAYLKKNGVDATLVGAPNYTAAAQMFTAGEGDAMFSGSGVAGTLIIKNLAIPSVRPLSKEGHSTYWGVIIASKGSPKFTGSPDYFKDKKVIFTALASSGEFFYRSIPNIKNVKATTLIAASHGAALDVLTRGAADIAIVKNRIWDKKMGEFPTLEKVGDDKNENPDMTLMVSKKADSKIASKISDALLSLKGDTSPEAQAVKEKLSIQGYIKTTKEDFKHTLSLLKKAGVTKAFDFKFE
ncbi:MAG: PhnD/SsuA/transferrin family substrate-binding protein [Nitrospirota bacterium]|nr:PhnD/SsuA/transferrin family substrate-binding protein [Nitrospirota bacterium]